MTFLRRMTGRTDLAAQRTELVWHGLQDADKFQACQGGELVFDCAANGLWLEADVLAFSLSAQDSEISARLDREAKTALLALSPEASFLHHFRQALITPVQRGEATLANLASSFAMSERTLARRLNAAGTDFRTEKVPSTGELKSTPIPSRSRWKKLVPATLRVLANTKSRQTSH